jgi:hypothetical protein
MQQGNEKVTVGSATGLGRANSACARPAGSTPGGGEREQNWCPDLTPPTVLESVLTDPACRPVTDARSGWRLADGGGNTRARRGGRVGVRALERGLDGGGGDLRGLRVDGDVRRSSTRRTT